MTEMPQAESTRVLDPMDRISEILFGLIMVLTYTTTLSVMTASQADVRAMLVGALGCNLAWGIIDGGLYLMEQLRERSRDLVLLRAGREAADDPEAARRAVRDALPQPLASAVSADQIETMLHKLKDAPAPPERPRLTGDDWWGALGIGLLCFLSTFPVVIPFIFIDDARLALRLSNGIAIAMLFVCGYAFARYAGIRPWIMGVLMVVIGSALTGVAIALGG
ncbi:MAG TPA: VIT1/CCC1 transporter family protein [Pseudorhodoplanes sp.]|nr:VIT1/CCC1 transporter family protein [Pseudorhodoplanes sp.]